MISAIPPSVTPAKSAGMNDAVAVALKVVSVGMRRFREAASAGMFHMHRIAGQHWGILALLIARA